MRVTEIHWLAGLLEGEGCFAFSGTPVVSLFMTDGDTVKRAADLLGCIAYGPMDRGVGRKPGYRCQRYGSNAIAWMLTVYSLMGERRKKRICEIIKKWQDMKGKPRLMATCHPDRRSKARGQCVQCYQRSRYARYATYA